MKMKKSLCITLSAVYLMNLAPSVVMAQTRHMAPGIVPIVTASAGNYNIADTQVTPILQTILGQAQHIQQADRDYVIKVERDVRAEYKALQDLVLGEFATLSTETMNSDKTVTSENYMKTVQKINQAKAALELSIDSMTSLADSLPATANVTLEGTNQSAGKYFNMDFSRLTAVYKTKLDKMMADASKAQVKVMLSNGVPQVINANNNGDENALSPKFNQPLYTTKQLKDFEAQINKIGGEVQAYVNNDREDLGNKVKELIGTFTQMYGKDEAYRFRGDKGDAKKEKSNPEAVTYYGARDKMFTEIVNVFWTRSYLRAKYGMQLGAIQPMKYPKKIANLDKFTIRTTALSSFRQELALSKNDLNAAYENMRNFMIVADERSQEIFAANTGISANKNIFASLLVKANSLMTFVGGQRPNAEVSLMVARLVFADIIEDKMLTSTGGRAELFSFYKTRYQTSAESKAIYTGFKCNFDQYYAESTAGKTECNSALAGQIRDVNPSGAGDVGGVLTSLNRKMKINQQQINTINNLQTQITLSVMSNGGTGDSAEQDAGRL